VEWGVTAPPETFIIGPDGTVLFKFTGPLVGTDYDPFHPGAGQGAEAGRLMGGDFFEEIAPEPLKAPVPARAGCRPARPDADPWGRSAALAVGHPVREAMHRVPSKTSWLPRTTAPRRRRIATARRPDRG
jgi:hypothetical protein